MFGMLKNILASCDGNMYLPTLHLPRVELHCKVQEILHRVTGSLFSSFDFLFCSCSKYQRSEGK